MMPVGALSRPTLRCGRERLGRAIVGALLLLLSWGASAGAASLYERSLPQLRAEAEKGVPGEFTFVVLGDNRGNDAVFRRALRLAKGYHPLFILHGGDVSDRGSAGEIARFRALVEENVPDIPFFVVAGNHEGDKELFVRELAPLDYAIESPRVGLKVVVADNSGYALRQKELAFLRREVETVPRLTFVAMHIPPKTERWGWHTFSDGARELTTLLAEKRVAAAFFGHVHIFDRDEIGGVPLFISGGAGAPLITTGFPGTAVYHIVVVRIRKGVATFEMVRVPDDGK